MDGRILRVRSIAAVELVPSRAVRRVVAVLAFAVATALGAQAAVPLPFTPVPLTLQLVFVILSGALLGPALGATSQLVYLAAGIAGLPIFSHGGFGLAHLLGPTGGYLLAFPLAAAVTGLLAGAARRNALGAARLVAALFAGSFVVLLGGTAWLAALTGDPGRALALGLVPFLLGDVLKVALAFLLAWRARERTLGLL